jgi:hypothetical protein
VEIEGIVWGSLLFLQWVLKSVHKESYSKDLSTGEFGLKSGHSYHSCYCCSDLGCLSSPRQEQAVGVSLDQVFNNENLTIAPKSESRC